MVMNQKEKNEKKIQQQKITEGNNPLLNRS